MTDQTIAREIAQILLHIKAVTLSPQQPFKFVSGIVSPMYTDNRLLMSYPKERKIVAAHVSNLIRNQVTDVKIIAGTATAGIAPAAWVADILELPMIFIRKESKGYGKNKLIEGIIKPNDNIVLIEDVISTGKSSLHAIDAIRAEGGTVNTCVAFFEYGFKDTRKAYEDRGIALYTLTNVDALVEEAVAMKIISQDDKAAVLAWRNDPWHWPGKKSDKGQPTDY